MDEYTLTASAMRAVRLYGFILSMGIMSAWFGSVVRLLRGTAPLSALVRPDTARIVALDREWTRAIWVMLAAGVFLIQLRWLSPWLPEVALLRIWFVGISLVDAVMLAAIFQNGRSDDRFDARRSAAAWGGVLVVCVLFAVTSR